MGVIPRRKTYPYVYKNGKLFWAKKGLGRRLGKRAGSEGSNGYRRVMLDGKYRMEHRVIFEMFHGPIPEGYEIDHINRNSLDNRIENLRPVPPSLNKQNVFGRPRWEAGAWRVKFSRNGVTYEVGRFKCFGQAIIAREEAVRSFKQ